jgi:16S rRNA processing protein RimM
VKEFFLIAKISSLYGHSGFVKVELYSDFRKRLSETDKVFIDFWGDKKILFLESVKYPGSSVVVKFKNFDNERDAGVLIGREVFVEDEDLVQLDDNSYYIHDLTGSKVFQQEEEIGEIIDVLTLPANDVIVIKRDNEDELLIPIVLNYIESFDPGKKRLVLKEDLNYDDED